MRVYLDTVEHVLRAGTYKPNRTAVDTVSAFSQQYTVDLSEGFPLLTTKKMDGFRWTSMLHELFWYLSGQEHIRELREKTGIWDEWADGEGHLDTAYGRFWRRYPVPAGEGQLPGESWVDREHSWVNTEETEAGDERLTFDQIQYVLDQLRGNPNSRRIVVTAWHPANAGESKLPPCHYTFVFNVQGDRLNLHLTQRSADLALGVPFNIACYSLLLTVVARATGFEPGQFSHQLVDAHVYCGTGDRGAWYGENLEALQERLQEVRTDDAVTYRDVRGWLEETAPQEADDETGYDHVPGLLEQLSREPLDRPEITIADRPLEELGAEDIQLRDYESHPGIRFAVAE
jgi:thymidylate synthase